MFVHVRTQECMYADVTCACIACEILVQMPTDMQDSEKCSRRAIKHTRVTLTCASSLN